MQERSHLYGVMGEFETATDLIRAAEKTRDAGYRQMDAYAPYPVEGLSEALGLRRSWVPFLTLIGGLGGGLTGFGLQYWVNVFAYPLNIGGRPLNSWPAFIPVTFELTILGAASFAVFTSDGGTAPACGLVGSPRCASRAIARALSGRLATVSSQMLIVLA